MKLTDPDISLAVAEYVAIIASDIGEQGLQAMIDNDDVQVAMKLLSGNAPPVISFAIVLLCYNAGANEVFSKIALPLQQTKSPMQ